MDKISDASPQIITVSSEDHHDTLVNGLWEFFNSQHGVDLFLEADNQMFSAHQLIVDVFIPSGIADLANNRFDSGLPHLLEFLYTGKVAVNNNQLENLQKIAKHFDFQMLISAIESIDVNGKISNSPCTAVPTLRDEKDEQPKNRRSARKEASRLLAAVDDSELDQTNDDDDDYVPKISGRLRSAAYTKTMPRTAKKSIATKVSRTETTSLSDEEGDSISQNESPPVMVKRIMGRPKAMLANIGGAVKRKRGRPPKNSVAVPENLPGKDFTPSGKWRKWLCEKTSSSSQISTNEVSTKTSGRTKSRNKIGPEGSSDKPVETNKAVTKTTKARLTKSQPRDDTKPKKSHRKQWRLPTDEPDTIDATLPAPSVVASKTTDPPKEKLFKCGHCNFSNTVMEVVAKHIRTEHVRIKPATSATNPAVTAIQSNSGATKLSEKTNDGTDDDDDDDDESDSGLDTAISSLNNDPLDSAALFDVPHHAILPTLRCSDCSFVTTDDNEYRVHLASHDPSVAYFKCHTCEQSFPCADSFNRHDKTVHADASVAPAVLRCPRCSYRPKKLSNYLFHLLITHRVDNKGQQGAQLCKCPRCDFTCASTEDMACHMRAHRCRICRCSKCEFTCTSAVDMKKHMIEHRDADPAPCQKCEHVAPNRKALRVHFRKAHHSWTVRLCDTCGYRSFSACRMIQHNRKHTGEKPFICERCGRGFGEIGTLKRHCKEVHAIHTRSFPCDRCGRIYRRTTTLAIHRKECGVPTEQRTPLKRKNGSRPVRLGTRDRTRAIPTKCRLCQCVLHSICSLVKHVKEEHPNEHGFECEQCGYTCKDPCGMQKHRLRHTGARPHKCRYCMRAFSDSRSRKRHERVHVITKTPHPCPECGKNFDWPDYLRSHLKAVHKIVDPANYQPVVPVDNDVGGECEEAKLDDKTDDNIPIMGDSLLTQEFVEYAPGDSVILHVIGYPNM